MNSIQFNNILLLYNIEMPKYSKKEILNRIDNIKDKTKKWEKCSNSKSVLSLPIYRRFCFMKTRRTICIGGFFKKETCTK